ncbi:MAG: putative ABC transporter permease [Lachnospiraceae bacterium]|nr:putative ABC transporter permease [Lachnospiraceae bacterium]MDY4968720.1 putative ABC transporter permease [Lachnospiraceae bacterium]
MVFTGYELVWLFLVWSFLGWVLETVMAAVKQKRFVNRGLINAPFCILYGVGAVLITVVCQELNGFWLFVYSVILATLLEWTAGHLIEKMYHERWWNYSGIMWNLDGYICVPVSIFWGILSVIMMKWGNPLMTGLFHLIPELPRVILVLVLLIGLGLDMAATLIIMSGRSRRIQQWEAVDSWLTGISSRLGKRIYSRVDARIRRAYPEAKVEKAAEPVEGVFAYGCSFHKLVWLFMIGAFLGDITETIFCRVTAGVWMSRSSVVWGPFSIVWGFAIAAATALLYKYRNRSDSFLFLTGTFLGGAYEYFCSVLSELVFGKVFWDYSEIPFNLGGRINLLYCFFWGIAAVVWIKQLYPVFSSLIEKVPVKAGKILTWVMIVFMCCNMAVSGLALIRSDQRVHGIEAEHGWQQTMDRMYDDETLERIYPNALTVE